MSSPQRIRALIPHVYLPAFLLHLGEGILIPTLPLYLRSLGMSLTATSVVLGAAGAGALLSNVPAAMWLERRGIRTGMAIGVILTASTSFALAAFHGALPLAAVQALSGTGLVLWALSRKIFILHGTSQNVRGRAMSMYGGINRAAVLVGPAIGGIVATVANYRTAFVLAGALTACALVALVPKAPPPQPYASPAPVRAYLSVFREHAKLLAAMGVGQMLTFAIRRGRYVILPLYAASIGLKADRIGLLVSASAFVDLAVSPVSGQLMDRLGRMYAVVPSFIVMGVGVALISLAHGFGTLLAAAALIGVGNGVGSGTMLTLSTDAAPADGPGPFLAALGVVRDGGSIIGPVLVGTIADAFSLGTSAVVLGCTGLIAAAVFAFGVGETRTVNA